jgi:hypothetical protein
LQMPETRFHLQATLLCCLVIAHLPTCASLPSDLSWRQDF